MSYKKIKGDLIKDALDGDFDAIVHGCNCFNTMGAGIARTIRMNFPDAYEEDCKTKCGDKDKLGTYSSIACDVYNMKKVTIINAYTQYHYWGGHNADYDAIEKVFKLINSNFKGKTIGIPRIGAGLAGGDWKKIKKSIKKACTDVNIIYVKYDQ